MGRYHTELLTLRRPTKISELCESVPKPEGAIPKNGLPIWDVLELDAKLPMTPYRKGPVVFTRNKLGKKLWRSPKDQEWTLYDPLGLEVQYSYEPLHDEHLKGFLMRPPTIQMLKHHDLINDEKDASCSLRQFNEYRRYLKRVYLDSVNRERQIREDLEQQRLMLWRAQMWLEKEMQRNLALAAREEFISAAKEAVIMKEANWRNKLADQRKRYDERIAALELRRKLDRELRARAGRNFDQRTRDNQRVALQRERQRKVATLRRWHTTDKAFRKHRRRERMKARCAKQMDAEHRWDVKVATQTHRLVHEQKLLQKFTEDMQQHVQEHVNAMAATWEKLQDDYQTIRLENQKKNRKSKKSMSAVDISKESLYTF